MSNSRGTGRRDPFKKGGTRPSRRNPAFLNQETEQPKKKGPSYGPLILLLAVTLVIGGLSLYYFHIVTLEPAQPEPAEPEKLELEEDVSAAGYDFIAKKDQRNIIHLKPDFAVNLRGLDGEVLFRVRIWLEVSDLSVVRELNDDRARFFRLMDDITRTLKSWTYADLAVGNGMDLLKDQIRDHVNQYVQSAEVVRVIFVNPTFKRILPRITLPPNRENGS